MNRGLAFIFKEGCAGLLRARFTGLVATTTVAVSLVLIGIFAIATLNLGRLIEYLRSRVELEVFLDDSTSSLTTQEFKLEIEGIEGVDYVSFVSKDSAVQEFRRLFSSNLEQTEIQDDYFSTLGYNPLPASFRVQLTEDFRNSEGIEAVSRNLRMIEGISPTDIVYRGEYLVTLEKYVDVAIAIALLVGSIVTLSALLLVSNNIRLIIASKQKIIDTMILVGATTIFVRMPLFIQGMIQGALGGLVSALFLYLLVGLAEIEIPGYLTVDWSMYLIIVNLGILFGLAGSFVGIRKHL